MNEGLFPEVETDSKMEWLLKLRASDPVAYGIYPQAIRDTVENYEREMKKKKAATAHPAKKHILCVDDNEDNCFMLINLLGGEGHEAKSADNIKQALELAHKDSFNLYVVDSWLSEGSGAELCQKIREFDPQTPIIFYSGAVYESDRREALRAGASAFVAKPNIEELLKTVNRLLS
jgi:CheY-like chemotaxis protein